jgi:hypothetical protein
MITLMQEFRRRGNLPQRFSTAKTKGCLKGIVGLTRRTNMWETGHGSLSSLRGCERAYRSWDYRSLYLKKRQAEKEIKSSPFKMAVCFGERPGPLPKTHSHFDPIFLVENQKAFRVRLILIQQRREKNCRKHRLPG